MDYYKFSFRYESAIETEIINDILAAALGDIGFESFVSEDDGLSAYVAEKKFDAASLADCLRNFPVPNIQFHHTQELIEDQNWNEEWEKRYFQPIRIGKECLIRASFHPEETGYTYPIIIDPKMAFGTGNHATTWLMLQNMLNTELKGREVLDMGCGTAVLAILAAKMGAARIVAVDIDEWAYNNAVENCRFNNTEDIHVLQGDASTIGLLGQFDYIFANINRNTLLQDIRRYASALKPAGTLFMSGFYIEDKPAIEAESLRNGLSPCSFTERDNWVAVQVKRKYL